jgi:hypothetical protein
MSDNALFLICAFHTEDLKNVENHQTLTIPKFVRKPLENELSSDILFRSTIAMEIILHVAAIRLLFQLVNK